MSRRSMTRDIHESIRLILGKHAKILLKVPVKLEKGGDKTENRILVFTAHRLFVMISRVPSKIDNHFHYLDFRKVESKRPTHISFTVAVSGGSSEKTYSFRPHLDPPDPNKEALMIDDILISLAAAVRRIYPGVPAEHVVGPIDVHGDARSPVVRDALTWTQPEPKDVGPCGGFSAQYASVCDYFQVTFREEVAWDVDTIYFSHDSHEMCLQDFDHLEHRDLVCIVSALEHNTWFTKLRTSGNNVKLSSDICDRILGVAAKSVSLQEIHMPSIGARWEFAARLSQAMSSNAHCTVTSLDLSCNFIEDRGINPLSSTMAKLSKGMHHLNLSYCSLTGKGVGNLMQALTNNRSCATTLTYLNLCGNSMREDSCCHNLCTFLAQPNVVAILDISSTETPLDMLFGALLRGCTTALTHLNLSRNPFSLQTKRSKDKDSIPSAFKQFFASTLALKYINVSYGKLPSEALKNLLLGLACNEALSNVELNLSNNQLGAHGGATVLESCIGGVKCVSRLDLSENQIENDMSGVINGISRNKSVISLNLSRNMTNVKTKHFPPITEAIVQLLQDEETAVQKLNLSDCKLKTELGNVINALGSNQCLQHLDISGNMMGDSGARLLAKALQINTRLRTINLDRNQISLQGYTDITYALNSNYAMRHIPFPTFDLQSAIKTQPDRVDAIIHRMQELLQRNSSPQRFRNSAQAFRLTQGFVMSSTQQVIDKVAASAQDNIDAMKKVRNDREPSTDGTLEQIQEAEQLIREADNSKHLLSALHENAARRANDVDLKLKQVSSDIGQFIASHVKGNMEAMLNCAEQQCPRVLSHKDGKLATDVRHACQSKCQISPEFLSTLITDQIGQEVHNKVNEINLIIANHISDAVIDEVIESVNAASTSILKSISNDMVGNKKKRSLTPDVLKESKQYGSTSEIELTETLSVTTAGSDVTSQRSEPSPLNTPQTSKKNMSISRKLRPKSEFKDQKVVNRSNHPSGDASVNEFNHETSKQTPDVVGSSMFYSPSATSTPNPDSSNSTFLNGSDADNSTNHNSEDTVPELPSSTALQHLGKARPKRAKKHAPSRGAVVQRSLDSSDDGVDNFYPTSPPPSNNASAGSTPLTGSPLLDGGPSLSSGSVRSGGGIFSHLKSSRSKNVSKEDLSFSASSSQNISDKGKDGGVTKHSNLGVLSQSDRKSPIPPTKTNESSRYRYGVGSGLSCLASESNGEDSPPPVPHAAAKPSPDKKVVGGANNASLSPSMQSISEIFSKSASGKISNKVAGLSPGLSPFASRKTESSDYTLEDNLVERRTSLTNSQDVGKADLAGSPDNGKKTPDEVIRRQGVGHGTNPELMAEMKEKRASMVPKTIAADETSSISKIEDGKDKNESSAATSNVFGRVRLRSTGLSGNLSSPTNESAVTDASSDSPSNSKNSSGQTEKNESSYKFSSNTNEDVPKMGGSIVGLRSNMFSSHATAKSSNTEKLPEAKPRTTGLASAIMSAGSSAKAPSAGVSSKISQAVSSGEENVNTAPTTGLGPRPKPLPKPRPWSIVGVDRKSGEMTSVSGGASSSPPSKLASDTIKSNTERQANSQESDKEKTNENKFDKFKEPTRRQSSGSGSSAANRGSVRDMIKNMNKGQSGTNSTPAAERKGSSLPRGVQPQSSSSSTSGFSGVSDVARKFSSENHKSGTSSPGSTKKLSLDKGSTETRESACKDDPRILKLDDDFDVLEV